MLCLTGFLPSGTCVKHFDDRLIVSSWNTLQTLFSAYSNVTLGATSWFVFIAHHRRHVCQDFGAVNYSAVTGASTHWKGENRKHTRRKQAWWWRSLVFNNIQSYLGRGRQYIDTQRLWTFTKHYTGPLVIKCSVFARNLLQTLFDQQKGYMTWSIFYH